MKNHKNDDDDLLKSRKKIFLFSLYFCFFFTATSPLFKFAVALIFLLICCVIHTRTRIHRKLNIFIIEVKKIIQPTRRRRRKMHFMT